VSARVKIQPDPGGVKLPSGSNIHPENSKGKTMQITKETLVEDILDAYPQSVSYFIMNKVTPFTCAGAYPTTLGEMLASRKVDDVEAFVLGLNKAVAESQDRSDSPA